MHIQPLRAAFDSFSGVVSGRHMAYGRYAIAARDCPNKAVIAQSLSPGTRARQAYIPRTEDTTCTDMAHCNVAFVGGLRDILWPDTLGPTARRSPRTPGCILSMAEKKSSGTYNRGCMEN